MTGKGSRALKSRSLFEGGGGGATVARGMKALRSRLEEALLLQAVAECGQHQLHVGGLRQGRAARIWPRTNTSRQAGYCARAHTHAPWRCSPSARCARPCRPRGPAHPQSPQCTCPSHSCTLRPSQRRPAPVDRGGVGGGSGGGQSRARRLDTRFHPGSMHNAAVALPDALSLATTNTDRTLMVFTVHRRSLASSTNGSRPMALRATCVCAWQGRGEGACQQRCPRRGLANARARPWSPTPPDPPPPHLRPSHICLCTASWRAHIDSRPSSATIASASRIAYHMLTCKGQREWARAPPAPRAFAAPPLRAHDPAAAQTYHPGVVVGPAAVPAPIVAHQVEVEVVGPHLRRVGAR